jgi:hypothetical protein
MIIVLHLDLEDYTSVLSFSNTIQTKYTSLDILLLKCRLRQYTIRTRATGTREDDPGEPALARTFSS